LPSPLTWIAGLPIFVLFEKVAPPGRILSHTVGAGLVASGICR